MNRLVEILRVALTALWAHKLRSFLTLLGVIIGVATIITVVSAVAGLNIYVEEQIFTLSPDVFIVTKFGIITSREDFMAALRRKNLTVREMERLTSLCSSCRDVGGNLQGRKPVRFANRRRPDVEINGSTANLADLYNLEIAAGRFFTDAEVRRAVPVAVIGWDVREELFPGLDPLGRLVTVDGYPLKVIGVLAQQGALLGRSQDNRTWIPIKVYDKVFGRNRSVDIWVRATSMESFGQAQEEVRVLLRRLRGLSFQAEDPFGMVTAEALQTLWNGISAAALAMMVLIAGISLVVGGIVIMNIMLVSVVERAHEIGVRAAIGAPRRDILLQFLLESSILATAGGAIGVGIGWGVSEVVSRLSPFPTLVRPSLVVVGLLLATAVGLVFGIWPAWKASRLNPIDALRAE